MALRGAYLPLLGSMQENYEPGSWPLTAACGLALALLLTLLNGAAIGRRIGRLTQCRR